MPRAASIALAILSVVTGCAAVNVYEGPAPELPNSDAWLRAHVNLSEYAVTNYPKDRWSHDGLIVDFSVNTRVKDKQGRWSKVRGDPVRLYRRSIEEFKAAGIVVGTYISGGDVMRPEDFWQYPEQTVSYERLRAVCLPQTFNAEWKSVSVDLNQPEARRLLADLIVDEATARGLPLVYLDNIRHPDMLPGWTAWQKTCEYLESIRARLNARGIRVMANIAVNPGLMSDADIDLMTRALDGATFEMPLAPYVRERPERISRAVQAYRRMLNAGFCAVLLPVLSAADAAELKREEQTLAAFAMIIREAGDRIFVTAPFWQPNPDWAEWPRRLGKPRGPAQLVAPDTLVREFAGGRLSVNLKTRTVELRRD